MDKFLFWFMVGIVAVIAIWVTKFAASQTNNAGFQDFAQKL